MFFVIFNLKTEEILYKTYNIREFNSEKIINMVKKGEFCKNEKYYQIAFYVRNDIDTEKLLLFCQPSVIHRQNLIFVER